MKDDGFYLSNILECIRQIELYVAEGENAFMANRMIQDAVIRNLEVIGEAVKQLSMALRQQNFDIPWRQMAGLRDILIHDYLRVDMDEVWAVVERDLPAIKPRIIDLLEQRQNRK